MVIVVLVVLVSVLVVHVVVDVVVVQVRLNKLYEYESTIVWSSVAKCACVLSIL